MANAEAKSEARDVEETPLPLNCKTWMLKVSIDCEGCKRKVTKILHKIEGVYRTDIDFKQQRVTVIGNVEAETLIKRLGKKKGRWAELLPEPAKEKEKEKEKEKAARKEKKQSKQKNKETEQQQQLQQQQQSCEGLNNGDKKMKGAAEIIELEPSKEPETSSKIENGGPSEGRTEEASEVGPKAQETASNEVKETKVDVQPSETGPSSSQSPPPTNKPAAENVAADKSAPGGDGCKMETKKGQNGNNKSDKKVESDSERTRTRRVQPPPETVNGESPDPTRIHNPIPHQHVYPHPTSYPYPYPPSQYDIMPPLHTRAYTVSYHTSYPTASSYGTSYYGPPPPENSYAYVHQDEESQLQPPRYHPDPYLHQAPDSFEMFSDENPNACSIM